MKTIEYKKNQVLDRLFALHRNGIKPGMERIEKLCEYLGNPEKKFKSIHIAGTNGKGTVASMLASFLTESGFKVGLYTSPHILDFNERIRINGSKISDEKVVNIIEKLLNAKINEEVTFFEITTALAFEYFAQEDIDYAVLETGMGGRLDCTNVVDPIMAVITRIDMDHMEFLGDSIEKIAAEKAGIIKSKRPVVISKNLPIVTKVIGEKAKSKSSKLILSDEQVSINKFSFSKNLTSSYKVQCCDDSYSFVTSLSGEHNEENLKTFFSSINLLHDIENISFNEKIIHNTFSSLYKNTGYRARTEVIAKEPLTIVDVAHNINAVSATVELLKSLNAGKFNIIFGIMKDKDYIPIFKKLNEIALYFYLVAPKIERALNFSEVTELIESNGIHNYSIKGNLKETYEYLVDIKENILVIGSFYLIEELFKNINKVNNIS